MSDSFREPDAHAEVFAFERRIWILLNLLLFFGAALAIWSAFTGRQLIDRVRRADAAKFAVATATIDSLKLEIEHLREPRTAGSGLDGLTRDEFRKLGLADPVSDLLADLERHSEFIPPPVAGMPPWHFSKAEIVNDRWAIAWIENGRRSGRMLLEYTVKNGARIGWKVLLTQPY